MTSEFDFNQEPITNKKAAANMAKLKSHYFALLWMFSGAAFLTWFYTFLPTLGVGAILIPLTIVGLGIATSLHRVVRIREEVIISPSDFIDYILTVVNSVEKPDENRLRLSPEALGYNEKMKAIGRPIPTRGELNALASTISYRTGIK